MFTIHINESSYVRLKKKIGLLQALPIFGHSSQREVSWLTEAVRDEDASMRYYDVLLSNEIIGHMVK